MTQTHEAENVALLTEVPARMSAGRRRATAMVVVLALLAGIGTAAALRSVATTSRAEISTGPSTSFEDLMFELLNRERTERGLRPLQRRTTIDNVAREWSDTMARTQNLQHRPSLSAPFDGRWSRLGENVGVGYGPHSLHNGFMRSPGHRANVLGDFQYVGVGVALAGTNAWITFNFLKGDPSTTSRYDDNPVTGYATGAGRSGPFYDLDRTVHVEDVEQLDDAGIAISCATYRFCPDEGLRRAEMAELLTRALDLPPARERFTDVAGDHPYADAIGSLAAAGITLGCNPPDNDRFCPERVVSRDEMASFFVRALDLRLRSERFRDVGSGNVHHRSIGALAASGITRGCNPPANDRYCPEQDVTRGQMASFVQRALGR